MSRILLRNGYREKLTTIQESFGGDLISVPHRLYTENTEIKSPQKISWVTVLHYRILGTETRDIEMVMTPILQYAIESFSR